MDNWNHVLNPATIPKWGLRNSGCCCLNKRHMRHHRWRKSAETYNDWFCLRRNRGCYKFLPFNV